MYIKTALFDGLYLSSINIAIYYMAHIYGSYIWIWLAEMDIDRGLDFPIGN